MTEEEALDRMDDEQMDEEDSSDEEELDEEEAEYSARDLQQALLDEEASGTPLEKIKELWELAESAISNADEGIALYTTYIYLSRRMGADVNELKNLFLEGKALLSERYGDDWDIEGRFRRNFAYFLYTKAKQPDEALKLWNEVLASDSSYNSSLWLEAINLERHFGEVDNARKLLYKALNAKLDRPYSIFEYFVQFEREEGTRQQVDNALEKINAQAERVRQNQAQNRGGNKFARNKPQRGIKQGNKPANKFQNQRQPKRKANDRPEAAPSEKTHKNQQKENGKPIKTSEVVEKDADGFVIPSLPVKASPNQAESAKQPTNETPRAPREAQKAPDTRPKPPARQPVLGGGSKKRSTGFFPKPRVLLKK